MEGTSSASMSDIKLSCVPSENDGIAWIGHIIDEAENGDVTRDQLLALALRAADRSPYDNANFLKKLSSLPAQRQNNLNEGRAVHKPEAGAICMACRASNYIPIRFSLIREPIFAFCTVAV